jgi:cytoskeletal protein RodZ
MAAEKPLYQRTWFIVLVTFVAFSILATALNGGSDEDSPSTTQQETSTPTPTPTPTESDSESSEPSAEPSEDPDSSDNISYFISSSTGQFRDLEKDVNDAIERTEKDQTIRLLGNVLEFTFNYGQLNALDAPTAIAEQWNSGMADLDAAIELSSDGATDFVGGDITMSEMINLLYGVRSQVENLRSIVSTLE